MNNNIYISGSTIDRQKLGEVTEHKLELISPEYRANNDIKWLLW